MSQVPIAGGGSDLSAVTNTLNTAIQEINARDVVDIFKDDTGTRRVLLGRGANGFYGLKVSPAGVDVYTATDDELVFNSNNNVFKIVQSGTATIPALSITAAGAGWYQDTTTISVAHGLSHVPLVIAFIEPTPSTYYAMPATFSIVSSTTKMTTRTYSVSPDATNIVFTGNLVGDLPAAGSDSFGDVTVKYYVLQETAN